MRDLNQEIINFNYDKNLEYNDFFVSKSNKHILNFLIKWPKWEKKFLNISGEKFSGKSHLINIFIKNLMVLNLKQVRLKMKILKKSNS